MEKYKHIERFEKIRVEQEELLNDLNECLTKLENTKEEYKALIEYYYSAIRIQDLEDDANNLIPQDLKRGVLSEDEIYNLMTEYHQISIRLLEMVLSIQKQ